MPENINEKFRIRSYENTVYESLANVHCITVTKIIVYDNMLKTNVHQMKQKILNMLVWYWEISYLSFCFLLVSSFNKTNC